MFRSKRRIVKGVLLLILAILPPLVTYYRIPVALRTPALPTSSWEQPTSRIDPSTFRRFNTSRGSAEALLRIYEEQHARHRNAFLVPTYHNHHLRLRFNVKSNAISRYAGADRFQGSIRTLHVQCLRKLANSTEFEGDFDLKLLFNVSQVNDKPMQYTLQSVVPSEPTMKPSLSPPHIPIHLVNEVILDVYRIYPAHRIFSFTHQWMDLKVKKTFNWPQWPLIRSCADEILNERIQRSGKNKARCSRTRILDHATSKQLFAEERSAVPPWLDLQYQASQSSSLVNSSTIPNRTRRLCPFESTSNPRVCSSEFQAWISDYQDWHAKVTANITDPRLSMDEQRDRILQGNIRFLLYETFELGIADRMVHLMTTYLIALLTKRLFLFDTNWPELAEVMQSSLDYERNSTILWYSQLNRLNHNLSPLHEKYLSSKQYSFSVDRFTRRRDYDRDYPERILHFQGHTGIVVHLLTSNMSVYRTFLTKKLHMDAENIFGCLYHSLLVYRLSALVERTSTKPRVGLGHSPEVLLQVLLSKNFYPIGVQIRLEDVAMQKTLDPSTGDGPVRHSENFLGCAADLIAGNATSFRSVEQVPVIFLLSDTVDLRRAALQRSQLPTACLQPLDMKCQREKAPLFVIASADRVFYTSYSSQQTSAFRLAMFDLFLFHLCEQHIITMRSGFGRIGVFASLKRRNITTIMVGRPASCLSPRKSTSLVRSAYHWSGI